MKKPILSVILAGIFLSAAGQQLSLLKDINPGTASSNICFLTTINNTLFFAANDGVAGMELWKSDGTEAGTVLVKDINEGSSNCGIGYLTNVNGILFFVANNGSAGAELWKSDGTANGTVMVRDIRTGSMGSNPSGLVNMNGTVFFAANDGVNGSELWRSDGTVAGTVMLKDINPFSASAYPKALAKVNNTLFFAADNGTNGSELWKTDGTAGGTVLLKDIWPGSTSGSPSNLVNTGGTLYFSANNGTDGTELWKSDGTTDGTVLVLDIWPGNADSNPTSLRSAGNTLFFSANNSTNGMELWKSNGNANNTQLVKDIWPGTESGTIGNFSRFISQIIFTGNDGINGYKTWESDGSLTGTRIATGILDPGNGDMQELVATTDRVFASINETTNGKELWSVQYSSILPMRLSDFSGRLLHNDAVLNWKAEQLGNSSVFNVERSINGYDFTSVGNLSPFHGTELHHYTFTDRDVNSFGAEKLYYRINQKDDDGWINYSGIIALQLKKEKPDAFLFPNPVINQLNLSIRMSQTENIKYQIINLMGKTVMQETKTMMPGCTAILLGTDMLAAGVYYLNLQGTTFNKCLQFIKQ